MKLLLRLLIGIPLSVVLLLVIVIVVALQTDMVSDDEFDFLVDLGAREGPGAVISLIRMELYGVSPEDGADPSYGRELVAGRGHAPWVMRGNLDGRPRMLMLALAPELWAAYDLQTLTPYQVWEGEVLFEGAVYDYRHGPQPASSGQYLLRNEAGVSWFLAGEAGDEAATLSYLGHEYGEGKASVALHYALSTETARLELREWPDVLEVDGQRMLVRRFESLSPDSSLQAGFVAADGSRQLAVDTLQQPLLEPSPIELFQGPSRGRSAEEGELAVGEQVVANNQCLSCHAENHRVAGPAWAQVAGKFRGKVQDEVIDALAYKVRAGGAGVWGKVPMPPHPQLSDADARAAVVYILSVEKSEANINRPLDADGEAYAATEEYDILPRLGSVHPAFALDDLAPEGFEPKVGGMAFRSDGKLVLSSWDRDGAVFLLDLDAPEANRVKRIAEGLHEPLGLTVVDDRIFVLQKQELTELIDLDGDEVIDRYRTVSDDWPANSNFHSFAFGLVHQDEHFYLLTSICVLPGGASCPEQLPIQGKLLKVSAEGKASVHASGFRTPNGITAAPGGGVYVTDNEGDWLPSSKLVRVRAGDFYGSRAVPGPGIMTLEEVPPAVWLPQSEVGNSPTQPLLLEEGPYAGQLIHGDVYNGGVKRVFLETVAGREQGAAFHFSGGFKGSVNRLARGPDGAIYVGEIGNPPNWGELGKDWYGLERLRWRGNEAFEILAMRATPTGFELELTQPLAEGTILRPSDFQLRQWFYFPNEQYGGPKYDEELLQPHTVALSADRKIISLSVGGVKAGRVVYLRLDDRLRSVTGNTLWTAEAWYTMNAIPGGQSMTDAGPADDGWRDLFDGETLTGWRNYGGDEADVRKWVARDGELVLEQGGFGAWNMIKGAVFGGGSADLIYYPETFRDFELSLEWKIAEGGNSGIFYLVRDEEENMPWLTGIEMQVLDNDGHKDGQIETHRAGDLYDLIAAQPETVRPVGEWNEVLIRIKDNQIEHWLNGKKVVSVERASEEWNALVAASKFADMPGFGKSSEGYIVLQDHGDPVWYRNIRIRRLFERPANAEENGAALAGSPADQKL